MRPLSRVRFDALAGYARQPMADYFSEELAWFEHGSERVLGMVIRDRTDDDFAGVVMARDRRGRFRAVELTTFEPTRRRAQAFLRRDMERLAMAPDVEYLEGAHRGPSCFSACHQKKLDAGQLKQRLPEPQERCD